MGLPYNLPAIVSETLPDFKLDTWRLVVLPHLNKAFRQYSGGMGIIGVILFDVRTTLAVVVAATIFLYDKYPWVSAVYVVVWIILRGMQRLKGMVYLEDGVKELNEGSPEFNFYFFDPEQDGRPDTRQPRSLYIKIWRKDQLERERFRDTVRKKKFIVDFNLGEEEADGIDGELTDYDGLGNFAGLAETPKPRFVPKKRSTVQIMQTSHGAQ